MLVSLGTIDNPAISESLKEGTGLETLIRTILGAMTVVAGLMLLGYLVYGAFMYITSQGDEKAIQKARTAMTNAMIGLVIIILLTTILSILTYILGLELLHPLYILEGMFV